MSDSPTARLPESAALKAAYLNVERAIHEVHVAARTRLPRAPTLAEIYAGLRARGDDDVFLSENPGP